MKKIWVILLCAVLAILLGAGAAAAAVYGKLNALHDQQVEVVQKPDVVSTPAPEKLEDETLVEVEGIPEDIGEDYAVQIPEDAEDEPEQKPIFEAVPINENVINVLLVGQDTGLEWNASTRSDSCMILSYDRANHSVKLISVMRDTWVPIEGHGWNRINAAYSFGGVGLLINTINDVYGLDIQNYVITGFDEFKLVIDEIDGLDMELTQKEAQYLNKLTGAHLEEGMNHLDGELALAHARNRRTGDGDFGRIQRQRNILLAAYQKVRSESDAAELLKLMEFGLGNVRTNMDPSLILTLGLEVLQAQDLQLAYSRVPQDGTWTYATKDGKSVLSVDLEENAAYLKDFLYGQED